MNAAPPLEAELVIKLTRLMEMPAAEALFRATPEGQAFARRFYGSSIHSPEELPYLARAWVDSRPPRRSLEDLYRSLLELRSFPASAIASESLELFAASELRLAPGPEARFLRFYSVDAATIRGAYSISAETFVSEGILPSEVGANAVADLLARSPFVRRALLETTAGRAAVRAVFKRAGVTPPTSRDQIPDALVRCLRQDELRWMAIDLGDRLHGLVGLESHILKAADPAGQVARLLALDERYAPELLVWKDLRAELSAP